MPTYYLLPCSCGKKTEVDSSQSGLTLRCECGAELTVPTMRGLATLERVVPAAESAAAAATRDEWSLRQGFVFLGLAIALVALFPAGYIWYTYPTEPTVNEAYLDEDRSLIGQVTLSQSFVIWDQLHTTFEDQPEHPDMEVYYKYEKQQRDRLRIAVGATVFGLLVAAAGLAIRPARQSSP